MTASPAIRRFARLELPDGRAPFVEIVGGEAVILSAAPWSGGHPTGEVIRDVDAEGRSPHARRLAPVAPTKIVCVGRTYAAHAKELDNTVPPEPLLFLKPPSSIVGPGGVVELPPREISSRVEHEAELGVVIGRRARRVSANDAAAYVFGLTALCDVTARDLQKKDGQWTRAKGMDTFCPVGPVVVTGLDARALSIECRVGEELRQRGRTADMVFGVETILEHMSRVMTLEPGDLVATGTPEGVGPLAPGDRLAITIPSIGTLEVTVSPPP